MSTPETPRTPDCIDCEGASKGMAVATCSKSPKPCGHHCNHSWTHEACCYCGKTWGEEAPVDAERERLLDAFEAIMDAEKGCGRLSGARAIAVAAVDHAVPILYAAGRLSDDDVALLERRGSLGDEAVQAIAALREYGRLGKEEL